jgi:hypothetical protein
VRLIEAGDGILEHDDNTDDLAHRSAVLASAGRYAEAFGPGYLSELRAEWPA